MALLELKNISKIYGELKALDNVSLHVDKGEWVAIMGPSGSGKSTMINLIPRLYDVSDGVVRFDGMDVRKLDLGFLRSRIRSSVGFEPDSVDIRAAAANMACPTLFVCGSQEILPGEAESKAVYDACAGRKELVTVPGSYRALWLSQDYRAAVEAFLPQRGD